ncbi:MAG: hypothetical protein ACRERU_22190 [Methylococcales bacterium]
MLPTLNQSPVTVTGSVSDASAVTVDVNGVTATVTGGTYRANVPPVLGANTLTAVAADKTGNQGSHSIRVTFQQAVGVRMNKSSGDGQAGLVAQPLPQALVVLVTDDLGNPVAGRPVTFDVTRNNGMLDANGSGVFRRTQQIVTDGGGKASVLLRLGDSAGEGNNRGLASATGVAGQVEFCASGLPAPADRIVTADGDNQRGTTGNPLANPLEAFVVDKDGNPVANVDVTFSIVRGGGNQDVTLTMPGVAGLALTVFANSTTFHNESKTGLVSISQIHLDQVPMPPPNGIIFTPPAWPVQPPGTNFDPPARITIPNNGLAPVTLIDIYQLNHLLNEFVNIGKGTVSEDGLTVTSDPGFWITVAGWGGGGPPPPPTGDGENDPCADSAKKPEIELTIVRLIKSYS